MIAGSRKQEIAEAQAEVDRVKQEMEQARRDWDRARELYTSAAVPTSERDTARTKYDTAKREQKKPSTMGAIG